MKIAIIRTYPKDDYSAHLCYLTMKKHNVADKYIFWAETGSQPLIESTGEQIIYRQPSGNFGGLLYVKQMISDMKLLPKFKKEDHIIFCDADIIMIHNPFDIVPDDADHAGIFGEAEVCEGVPHVSGQLNIIMGWLWNKYIKGGERLLDELHTYQTERGTGAGTADDTLFSIFSHTKGAKQFSFPIEKYWLHDKTNNEAEYKMNLAKWT